MITVAALFQLILILLAVGLLVGLVQYVVRTWPIPDPLGRIINIAAVVIAILVVVVIILQFAGVPMAIPVR